VFSKNIEFCELLKKELPDAYIYHSKLSKKERELQVSSFSSQKGGVLISAAALNQGLNIPNIDAGISVSFDSTPLTFQQQQGRTSRMQEGKIATFVNLYYENTQEESWLTKRLKGQTSTWLKSTDVSKIT
jgi:superfamily II DNA or RNA helicase